MLQESGMKSFKSYIKEATISVDDLDMDFIRRAEKVTSFNLETTDFESTENKAEIQYLLTKNFFPEFDTSKTLTSVDKDKLNALIRELKSINKSLFAKLHDYKLKGVGPGEATLYYLIDNSRLGGGGSAGVDLVVGSKKYEIKGVKPRVKAGDFHDFKLGGTVRLDDIMGELADLKEKLGMGSDARKIPQSEIEKMKKDAPREYSKIEKKFGDRAFKYFEGDEVILINNDSDKREYGEIIYVGKISRNNIGLERVTQGTIKPTLKFK